jgi:dienelactone hydrolase
VRSLFSVGFCFGGALSYLQAASGLDYAGVIGFYGWPLGLKRWPDRPKPIDAVSRYKSPVLSLFGGADEGIRRPTSTRSTAHARRPRSSTTPPCTPAPAQLLRPQVHRVRRRLRRRVEAHAGVHTGNTKR